METRIAKELLRIQHWLEVAASIVAAWFYTGGSRPYGYQGLGEIFVFVFFGLVAVVGTSYTQTGAITWVSVVAGAVAGAWACAILMVNNIRDAPGDALVGKHTLAVRLGDTASRWLFVVTIWFPFALIIALAFATLWALAGLAAIPVAIGPSSGGRWTSVGLSTTSSRRSSNWAW